MKKLFWPIILGLFVVIGITALKLFNLQKDQFSGDELKTKHLEIIPEISHEIKIHKRDIPMKEDETQIKDTLNTSIEVITQDNEVDPLVIHEMIDKKIASSFESYNYEAINTHRMEIIERLLIANKSVKYKAHVKYKNIAEYIFLLTLFKNQKNNTVAGKAINPQKSIWYNLEGFLINQPDKYFSKNFPAEDFLWREDNPYLNYDLYQTAIFDEDIPVVAITLPVPTGSDKESEVLFFSKIDGRIILSNEKPISWHVITDEEASKLKSQLQGAQD